MIIFGILLFICFTLIFVNGRSYASTIDYPYQYYTLPEYFRTLFYQTKNLLPSYAPHLGASENIYNFSYYGLLNPIILLSYLLPFVPMKTYLAVSTAVLYLASVALCYIWIAEKTENRAVRVACTLLYGMSGPLIFHTHRHVMFINYLPFVFTGLLGIEKYHDEKSPWLLVVSNFLIITSSYFFSIPALFSLFLYSIYLSLERHRPRDFKSFFQNHLRLVWYFVLPVLLSSVLLLPSLKAILDNRFQASAGASLLHYLTPTINLKTLLFDSYGLGLCIISLFAIVYAISRPDKSAKFLGLSFALIICFPIFSYLFNGLLYPRPKVFIPFLPLVILLIMRFFEDILFKKKPLPKPLLFVVLVAILLWGGATSYPFVALDFLATIYCLFLFRKTSNPQIFLVGCLILSLLNCLILNLTNDSFVPGEVIDNQYSEAASELIATHVDDYARTADLTNSSFNLNNIRNLHQYKTTVYSSVINKHYTDFYWHIFDIENPNRNNAMLSDANNPLLNIYLANRYLLSRQALPDYELVDTKDDFFLYRNHDAFSIGYVNYNLMTEAEFDSLEYPFTLEALLSHTIVQADVSSSAYASHLEDLDLNGAFDSPLASNYEFYLDEPKQLELVPNQDFSRQLLIISFKMNYTESCAIGDTSITINDIKNTLTCSSATYPNKNHTFTYIFSEPDRLSLKLTPGHYNISDVQAYVLNYDSIKSLNTTHDNFVISEIAGDTITGDIDVKHNNGYFSLSIPYDEGYHILVDGMPVAYELVNKAFIGFKIAPGHHHISIRYRAPWLQTGKLLTAVGLCLLVSNIIYIRRKQCRKKSP